MAAERIVWDGNTVDNQLDSLRDTLTRRLDDAADGLRQARNILRRQDVLPAVALNLDATERQLENARERIRALWQRARIAKETLDRVEKEMTALIMTLPTGGDASPLLSFTNLLRLAPSLIPLRDVRRPWAEVRRTPFHVRRLPARFSCVSRPVDRDWPSEIRFQVGPIHMEATDILRGRTLIDTMSGGAAWSAPQSITPLWLKDLLANQNDKNDV